VRVSDLTLDALLHFQPDGGIVTFAGQRAVILDTASLGLLRKELIHTLGEHAARGVLTRFGFAHGWRTAESLREAFAWDDPSEWRSAGGRLHALQGLVLVEGVHGQGTPGRSFAEALWHESYEAEQHLVQLGQSDGPVCWSLAGYVSGYLSRCNEAEIYCVEVQCLAHGDPVCRLEARRRSEWGADIEPHLVYYERDCLDESLRQTREALRRLERRLKARQRLLGADLVEDVSPGGLVARSPQMRAVVDLARRAAKVDTTVLVTGESGVGKERVAQLIHESSPRTGGPLLAVNCGAISETLIESELFGHARGAFTGASHERVGLFEAAQGGTLFLDEVGELPPATQVKLLRVLQERQVRRVGENRSHPIDVRVVAATNRDLIAEVAAGRFREDLLYRLKVVELTVPPLRTRPADILPLARFLVVRISERLECPAKGIDAAAADALVRYGWPGNVRELENALERAVVVAQGDAIALEDLPREVRSGEPPLPRAVGGPAPTAGEAGGRGGRGPLADVERRHILAVLEANQGNRAAAAAELGIGIATLYRRLKAYRSADADPQP
jgi:transcriptional regulator with PAS, ATPase and Fis domain